MALTFAICALPFDLLFSPGVENARLVMGYRTSPIRNHEGSDYDDL
jgi:hypothetical protein